MRMLERLLKPFWSEELPRIRDLQVEVSTCCQFACDYCPRTALKDRWTDSLMPITLFKEKIIPWAACFDMFFLQGWGEPLLNPHFWDMMTMVKQAGRRAGFLTNGMLFDKEAAKKSCELGVDIVSFTLVGAGQDSNERHRKGAFFQGTLGSISLLAAEKKRRGSTHPTIGISYTLMPDNIAELPDAVRLAASLGVDQITLGHVDCIPHRSLEAHALYLAATEGDEALLWKAAGAATEKGIAFKYVPVRLQGEIMVCEPAPLKNTLFITADGAVYPCHQMALPEGAATEVFFRGQSFPYQRERLGNLGDTDLRTILLSSKAKQLRENTLARAECAFTFAKDIPPVPAACNTCYKLYGM